MSTTTKDRPSARPVKLIGLGEVATLLGKSRQRAYYWSNRAGFPAPVTEVAGGGRLWSPDEVRAWIAANRHRLEQSPSARQRRGRT